MMNSAVDGQYAKNLRHTNPSGGYRIFAIAMFVSILIYTGVVNRFIIPTPGVIAFLAPAAVLISVSILRLDIYKTSREAFVYMSPMLILGSVSIIWAYDATGVATKVLSFALLILTASAVAVFAAKDTEVLRRVLIWYGVLHSGISLILIYFGGGLGRIAAHNLIGIVSHKTALTSLSAIFAITALCQLLSGSKRSRAVSVITIVLGIWVLAIGGGGSALLGGALAATVAVLIASGHIAAARAAMLLVGMVSILLPFVPQLVDVFSDVTGKDTSLSGRQYLWNFARNSFYDNPIFGAGFSNAGADENWQTWQKSVFSSAFGTFEVIPNFHNQWIEIAYMLGVPGVVVGVWLLVVYPTLKVSHLDLFPATLLSYAYVQSGFGSNIIINTQEALLYIVAIVVIVSRPNRDKRLKSY